MLVRFTSDVSIDDIGRLTERCEELGVKFKFIQETGTSYLVIESAEVSKIDELYHQLRHQPFVDVLIRKDRSEDPLRDLKPVQFMAGNRRIGHGARPVLIAGSPFLESRKQAVELATTLAGLGVNVYKAGPYRPTETLAPKALYERSGSIVKEIIRRAGIPSTGMIEALGPRTALTTLEANILHVPGAFMFETTLREQLAKMGLPVFLERHPDASISLWLEAAGSIVMAGNPDVALVETGRMSGGNREIDMVALAWLVETCPLPVMVYASRAASTKSQVEHIARASLACGASGVLLDVHPTPGMGLLTEGYCVSVEEFEEIVKSLQGLLAH
jgi:3-deoxy-7-phosphoheptulonate synthase